MENACVTFPVPFTQVLEDFGRIVDQKIDANHQKQLDEKLLNTNEVLALFNITKITLNVWINEGKIPTHKVKGKNFFKHKEIMDSLQTVKRYSRSNTSSNDK